MDKKKREKSLRNLLFLFRVGFSFKTILRRLDRFRSSSDKEKIAQDFL